jgi:lactoylglutathione lyase
VVIQGSQYVRLGEVLIPVSAEDRQLLPIRLRSSSDLLRVQSLHPQDVAMTRYLHTMYRITDPERSRSFYEALRLEFTGNCRSSATQSWRRPTTSLVSPGQDEELELTFNHDGRSYELGTGYGHIALAVDDLDATLARLKEQGITAERSPIGCVRVVRGFVSSEILTRIGLS